MAHKSSNFAIKLRPLFMIYITSIFLYKYKNKYTYILANRLLIHVYIVLLCHHRPPTTRLVTLSFFSSFSHVSPYHHTRWHPLCSVCVCIQGAAKLTKDDIEKVFSLYDRASISTIKRFFWCRLLHDDDDVPRRSKSLPVTRPITDPIHQLVADCYPSSSLYSIPGQ